MGAGLLTIATGLYRCLNVANALDGDAILVVPVHILVLKLTNLIDQDTQFVGNIGYVIVARFAPDGELLLRRVSFVPWTGEWQPLTATSMRSLLTSSMLRITFFSILTSCESFFARSGPNAPADL